MSSNSQLVLLSESSIGYNNHSGRLKKEDVVEVIVDRNLGNLSFAVSGSDYGIA